MNAPGSGGPPPLALSGITKRFGSLVALDGVDMVVQAGSVHALLGENGAGKSTLMRIAFGTLAPDAGTVRSRGARPDTRNAPRAGIGMVHQHLSLVQTLTATENFVLGGTGALDLGAARRRLQALGDASGLRVEPDALVCDMGLAQRQRLEILKALGREPHTLIMDEPTAMLAPAESTELLRWIRRFADGGGSVVLVTHKLREATEVADEITVLRRGKVVWSGGADAKSERELAEAIFPEPRTASPPAAGAAFSETVVRAAALRLRRDNGSDAIADATFEIRAGEIVGVAAVEGSGQQELLRALAGLHVASAGVLEGPPRAAYIPADRTREALVLPMTLAENVALRGLGDRTGRMPWREIDRRTGALITSFAIAAPGPAAPAASLSGGNQQRLVVARELDDAPALVVADNPTRGLDLQATAFVLEQLRAAASRGAAVVVHSADLDELLAICTRMLVVFGGRVFPTGLDREAVGRAMLGAA